MKRSSALLLIVMLLMVSVHSKKAILQAQRSGVGMLLEAHPKAPAIEVAAPEDAGSTATAISPLSILKAQAMASQIKTEQTEQYVPQEPLPIDHPIRRPLEESKNVLHKVFSVNKYAQFAFVVPPRRGNARLRGTFRSFTKRSAADSTSDRTADVDLMLMSDQEFSEFLHGPPQSVTYEVDSTHNQAVDWRVPTTYGEPQTYHLIFSNSGGTKTKFVEADFTVSF
jgi:hypothetical protein